MVVLLNFFSCLLDNSDSDNNSRVTNLCSLLIDVSAYDHESDYGGKNWSLFNWMSISFDLLFCWFFVLSHCSMCMLHQLINTCPLLFFRTIKYFPIQQSSLDNGDVTTFVLKSPAIMKTKLLDESLLFLI